MAMYSKKAQEKIGKVMQKFKEGTLKSGKNGKDGKVKILFKTLESHVQQNQTF